MGEGPCSIDPSVVVWRVDSDGHPCRYKKDVPAGCTWLVEDVVDRVEEQCCQRAIEYFNLK